jgi:hypothetical protein
MTARRSERILVFRNEIASRLAVSSVVWAPDTSTNRLVAKRLWADGKKVTLFDPETAFDELVLMITEHHPNAESLTIRLK